MNPSSHPPLRPDAAVAGALPGALCSPVQPQRVALLIEDGADGLGIARLMAELQRAGVEIRLVAPTATPIATRLGGMLSPDDTVDAVAPGDFDAVLVPAGDHCAERLMLDAATLGFVRAAYARGRTVAAVGAGVRVLEAVGVPADGAGEALDEPLPGVLVGHGGHCTLANFGCRLAKRLAEAPHLRGDMPLAA